MAAEKAREFEAGIAGRAENRGFEFGRHPIFFRSPPIDPFPDFPT